MTPNPISVPQSPPSFTPGGADLSWQNTKSLAEIMNQALVEILPAQRIAEAAEIMARSRISSLVVTENDAPVGIVTERDILRALTLGLEPQATEIRAIMSSPVVTAPQDMDYREVYRYLVRHKVRHLLVVDSQGRRAGIVSESDLKSHIGIEFFVRMREVRGAMTTRLITLAEGATVGEAAALMEKHHIGCIIVEREHRPVGIITERDMVRLYQRGREITAAELRGVMSSPVRCVDAESGLQEAVQIMQEGGIRRIVVVDGQGQLSGLLTQHDIVKRLEGEYVDEFIRERRRVETELQKTQAHLAHVLNVSPAATYVMRADPAAPGTMKIAFTTEQITRISGYTLADMIQPGFWENGLHPDDRAAALANQATLVHEGRLEHQYRFRHKDGQWIWIEDRLVANRDEQGNLSEIIGSWLDITYRKQAEQDLRKINETLESKIAEEVAKNREKDHLLIRQSRLAALGEMLGNIAHQWRQPLNTLALILGNIKDAYAFNELTESYLAEVMTMGNQVIKQMSSTIDDFRNFFNPNKQIARTSLLQVVENAHAMMEASLTSHAITVRLDRSTDVEADVFPSELAQVVLNLFSNAKDAITDKGIGSGAIQVAIRTAGKYAVITVSDNGGGAPADVLPKIFDPYFTTKPKGTGIGLYMSKMIVEQMGGHIEARNTAEGLEVSVGLPLPG
ncbi:MAG: CBS domain-containing protein [Sulfuricella sp.]|nr:CBS domain-containing protein [Sulfuricella sp.]